MTPLHLQRGGGFYRVADPTWDDPLDPSFAAAVGGRWNPPASFPTLYLCATRRLARANVARKFVGLPYGPEDLDPAAAPMLVETVIGWTSVVDVVTDDGCRAVGLPATYPLDATGATIDQPACQPIGAELQAAGEPGLAVRSAAPAMTPTDEEVVWFRFDRDPPVRGTSWPFLEWYPIEMLGT